MYQPRSSGRYYVGRLQLLYRRPKLEVRLEALLENGAGAGEAALDGFGADLEDLGDFGVGEFFQRGENQRRAQIDRKGRESTADGGRRFRSRGRFTRTAESGIGNLPGQRLVRFRSGREIQRVHRRRAALFSQAVHAEVQRHAVEPREQLRGRVEPGRSLVEPEKGFLGNLLGVGPIPEEAIGKIDDGAGGALHDLMERLRLPSRDAFYQFMVATHS